VRISEQEWTLDAGVLAAEYLRILKRKPNKGWASLTSAHGIVSVMGLAMKLSETRAFAPLDQRSLTRTRGVLPSAGKCIRAMGALPPSRDTQRR